MKILAGCSLLGYVCIKDISNHSCHQHSNRIQTKTEKISPWINDLVPMISNSTQLASSSILDTKLSSSMFFNFTIYPISEDWHISMHICLGLKKKSNEWKGLQILDDILPRHTVENWSWWRQWGVVSHLLVEQSQVPHCLQRKYREGSQIGEALPKCTETLCPMAFDQGQVAANVQHFCNFVLKWLGLLSVSEYCSRVLDDDQ